MNIEDIRDDFPILKKEIGEYTLVYLDNAATTHKPRVVLQEVDKYYKKSNANIHRGIHTLSHESTMLWEDSHRDVAKFINARETEEIVFTKNATEGLNLVAYSYGKKFLKEGDVVVLTEMEHHSNIIPWQQLAKEKKLKIEWIPVLENARLDVNYLEYLIKKYKDKLKILSVAHVSNVLGCVNDVKHLAQKIHSVGGVICVDAAQSIPHYAIDVQELDCDFLAFSGHKIYAPMGIGVLYGKKNLLEKMEPWITGGDMVTKVTKNSAQWAGLPEKFEAGTPNVSAAVGLSRAIEWFSNFDITEVQEHESNLMQIALSGLLTVCDLEVLGSKSSQDRVGVISFRLKHMHPHDVASLLDGKGIAIRAGYHCCEPLHERFNFGPSVRASFGIYNTQEEVRYFINCIKSISGRFV